MSIDKGLSASQVIHHCASMQHPLHACARRHLLSLCGKLIRCVIMACSLRLSKCCGVGCCHQLGGAVLVPAWEPPTRAMVSMMLFWLYNCTSSAPVESRSKSFVVSVSDAFSAGVRVCSSDPCLPQRSDLGGRTFWAEAVADLSAGSAYIGARSHSFECAPFLRKT
jgi:hypothetical protein